jgi:uncharacterized protein
MGVYSIFHMNGNDNTNELPAQPYDPYLYMNTTERTLFEFMSDIPVVDAHEHLPAESLYLANGCDVFNFLTQYTGSDLSSAGMTKAVYDVIGDRNISILDRWRVFKPYWESVKYGSFARTAILTAHLFYNVSDINEDTIVELHQKRSHLHVSGIYRAIRNAGNIKYTITQSVPPPYGTTEVDEGFFAVMPILDPWGYVHYRTPALLAEKAKETGIPKVKTLDDYLELWSRLIKKWRSEKVIGIKIQSKYIESPDYKLAQRELDNLLAGQKPTYNGTFFNPLDNLVLQHAIETAAALDMAVAVHSGLFCGDIRITDPKHMAVMATQYPQARFDLYHLGIPFSRDAVFMAKQFANISLNLCWTHSLSPTQTTAGINELLDTVPINKVFAFGGDYASSADLALGHLHLAKENISRAFSLRIDQGLLALADAKAIIGKWFYDNPILFYRLPQQNRNSSVLE